MGATNNILRFASEGTESNGDILSQSDYSADDDRLQGHQAGLARRALENMALRQLSYIAAGLGQFIANRNDDDDTVGPSNDLDTLETQMQTAIQYMLDNSSLGASLSLSDLVLALQDTNGNTLGSSIDLSAITAAHIATSSTAAGTAAKVATTTGGDFVLAAGKSVLVTFDSANTLAAALTLNVDDTGAVAIVDEAGNAVSTTHRAYFPAGVQIEFVYDGTNFVYKNRVVTAYRSSTAGYEIMANGKMTQRGKFSSLSTGKFTVTFPKAFAHECDVVVPSYINATSTASCDAVNIYSMSTSSWVGEAVSADGDWIALSCFYVAEGY